MAARRGRRSQDVEFSANVFRHAGAVFNISGHDDIHRSGQLARLLIRNNLAYDIHSGTWGGNGVFAQIGNEPRDITIDHNTILHTGNIITFYSGRYLNSSGASVTGGPDRRASATRTISPSTTRTASSAAARASASDR